MPVFPDSVDDQLLVDGLNLRTTRDYILEAINGARIDLNGDVYVNGNKPITKEDGPVVATDYGVVGNGVADDTVALQNFLNAEPKRAHYLPSPSVKYRTTSTLSIPDQPGYHLYGDSRWHTLIELDANNTPILETLGLFQHNIVLEHIGLVFKTNQPAANTNAIGLRFTGGASYSSVFYNNYRNLYIKGAAIGIKMQDPVGFVMEVWNCTFSVILFDDISKHLIYISSGVPSGCPVNVFSQITCLNVDGPVATDAAFVLTFMEAILDGIDIEDWNGKLFDFISCTMHIRNLHVERHNFTASNQRLMDFGSGTYTIDQYNISITGVTGGYWILFISGAEVVVGSGSINMAGSGVQFGLATANPPSRIDILGGGPRVALSGGAAYHGIYFTGDGSNTAGCLRSNYGTATWDPANVANGAQINTTLTVKGAAVGDVVSVGFSNAVPAGVLLIGSVTAFEIVTVTMFNQSGGAVDLASGTLTARVWKPWS